MKKRIFLLIALVILWGLTACVGQERGYLDYQEKNATFVGTCTLPDGEYVLQIRLMADGGRSLTFLAPETVEGCSYFRSAEGDYCFSVDDMTFPVEENPTAKAIFDLFSLKESDLRSATLSENAGERLNVLEFDGDITVYLSSSDGLPLRFEHPLLTLTLHADERQIDTGSAAQNGTESAHPNSTQSPA